MSKARDGLALRKKMKAVADTVALEMSAKDADALEAGLARATELDMKESFWSTWQVENTTAACMPPCVCACVFVCVTVCVRESVYVCLSVCRCRCRCLVSVSSC